MPYLQMAQCLALSRCSMYIFNFFFFCAQVNHSLDLKKCQKIDSRISSSSPVPCPPTSSLSPGPLLPAQVMISVVLSPGPHYAKISKIERVLYVVLVELLVPFFLLLW